MYKSDATKNLMNLNKKVFTGLHKLSNMNFEDLFICMEFTENFTHKRVLDRLKSYIKFLNNASAFQDVPTGIEDYNIFLIWEDTRYYCNNQMNIAQVDSKGFKVTRDDMTIGYYNLYKHGLHAVYTKSDFEEQRKNPNIHWWVVAQQKDMAIKNNTEGIPDIRTDSWIRYHVTDVHNFSRDWGKEKYIARITVQQSHRRNDEPFNIYDFYGDVKVEDMDKLMDKSGYFKQNIHRKYARRLRELKSERAKHEVDNIDCIEKLAPVQIEFNRIKDILYTLASDKATWNDDKKLEVVAHAMDNMADFTTKINNYIAVSNDKHWTNCTELYKCLDNFTARLGRIKEIMREGDICV